jgi:hypothetical protein
MLGRVRFFAGILSLASCTQPVDTPAPRECLPGELAHAGGCLAAGLQLDGCAAGTARDKGACLPAGVPEGECGEGFTSDASHGCQAILPAQACSPGAMAVPGEGSCGAVAPCPDGTWGGIADGSATHYVDGSFAGKSDGSKQAPWRKIGDAIAAASAGAVVAVAAGSYAESLVLDKPIVLRGKCPSLVTIASDATAIMISKMGAGSEVRGVAVTAKNVGLRIAGKARVEAVRIHDTGGYGVRVEPGASATLERVLVEKAVERGLYVEGAEAVVYRSVFRDIEPSALDGAGRGVNVRDAEQGGARGRLTLTQSLVERTREIAIMVHASDATIEGSVVAHSFASTGKRFGRCIAAQKGATLLLRRGLVSDCRDAGVFGSGSKVTLEGVTVRDIAVTEDKLDRGYGVVVQFDAAGKSSQLDISKALIARTAEVGVFIGGSLGTLSRVRIADVQGRPDNKVGWGMAVQANPSGMLSSDVALTASMIERVREVGVFVEASKMYSDGLRISDVAPDQNGGFGRAVHTQPNVASGVRGDLLLRSARLERLGDAGVVVVASSANIEATAVSNIGPKKGSVAGGYGIALSFSETGETPSATLHGVLIEQARGVGLAIGGDASVTRLAVRDTGAFLNGTLGDGIVVNSFKKRTAATIAFSEVMRSARAGVASFGAEVTLNNSRMGCNALALDGEQNGMFDPIFHDRGGNDCSCGSDGAKCRVLSTNIAPPAPLDPVK